MVDITSVPTASTNEVVRIHLAKTRAIRRARHPGYPAALYCRSDRTGREVPRPLLLARIGDERDRGVQQAPSRHTLSLPVSGGPIRGDGLPALIIAY